IHHSLALIAFFAWVGLGSDGLSSSAYGPEEAFLQLGAHRHLALYLVLATIGTVFLISASYSQIIGLCAGGGLRAHHRHLGRVRVRRHLLVPASRAAALEAAGGVPHDRRPHRA